jgi:uncharacterized protein YbjQ (UPF0145 family)
MSDLGEQPLPIPCTTGNDFHAFDVQHEVGLAFGLFVRSIGMAKGFTGGIKAMRAGEVTQYTQVLEESRREALERLVTHAQHLGGNAVLAVRFDSSDVGEQGLQEILAYGTAVVVTPRA